MKHSRVISAAALVMSFTGYGQVTSNGFVLKNRHKSFAPQYRKVLSVLLFFNYLTLSAQDSTFNKEFKDNTIQRVSTLLRDNYVFEELGIKTADYLNELNTKEHFKLYNDLESFALEITKAIYAVSYDKHISVSLKQQNQVEGDKLTKWVESRMGERNYFRQNNANFKKIQKLHGNIGYLELRGFYGLAWGKDFADYALEMLATSDAIIIDLRNNSGGRGDMVNYLLSHFFEKPVITGRSIKRKGSRFIENVGQTKEIEGNKILPKIPLFILTSTTTFSAAEAFTYPLKIYKRAIIIGETTRGGANAGDLYSLNNKLNIFIPDVAGKHPVKNESYEGVGIKPDIKARNGDALEIAIELAQDAAEEYKAKNDEIAKSLLMDLDNIINVEKNPSSERIINAYLACRKQNLVFEEWEINALAYQFFSQNDKRTTAETLFKANTILYPESANTFDSYAEALLKNKKVDSAILNYEKAVFLSKKYDLQNLKMFENNLEKAKKNQK